MRSLLNKDLEESLSLSFLAIEYAEATKDSLSVTKALYAQSYIFRRLERYLESITVAKRGLGIAERNGFDDELGRLLNILAVNYTILGNFDKALEFHFQSLILNEKYSRYDAASITLNNIGLVYYKLVNFEESIKYYQKSLDYKNKSNDTYDLDRLLINMALSHNQLGQYEIAEGYITKALSICKDKCSDIILTEARFGLGIVYKAQGELKLAQKYFRESLLLARKLNEHRFEIENLTNLALISYQENNYDSAKYSLIIAEKIALKYDYDQLLIGIYKLYSDIYEKLNDYKNAAFYSKKYSNLKDSTFNSNLIKNLANVQTKFAERENLATISTKQQIIEQQRYVSMLATVVAILSGLLILLIMRVNRITRRLNSKLSEEVYKQTEKLFIAKTKLEKSNRSLRDANDELDNLIYKTSHDLKGPLATLKGICNVALIDVKDEAALDYFLKLDMTSDRLNHVLDRLAVINFLMSAAPASQEVNLSQAIERILEEEKSIDYKKDIRIETSLEPITGFQTDPTILNHVLESLIDNAFKYHKETQRVESFVKIVTAKELNNRVRIRIIDNGIGMNVPEEADVFRLFFRASERSQTGGTGLFIAKTAARKLYGDVTYNHKETAYTEFEITLPLVLDNVKIESEESVETN